jgi:Undecaprenyl-phosphate glucose phosphotransferase
MLKNYERTFETLQKLIDALIVALAWLGSYYFRFNLLPNAQIGISFIFFKATLFLIVVTLYFFSKYGLYTSQRMKSRSDEIFNIFKANLFSTLAFVVILYFFAENRLSRSVLVLYFISSIFLLTLSRMLIRNFLRSLRRQGKNLRHVLLIGHGEPIENYVQTINSFKDAGIKFKGWIDSKGLASKYQINEIEKTLDQARKELNPDSIVVCYTGDDSQKMDKIVRDYHNDIIPLQILPDLTYSFVGYKIEDCAGIPIMHVNQPNFSNIDMTAKRILDVISTGLGLLFISPLLFLIALGVKLSSPGPIFYGQERVGLDGRTFKMWKFRSMKVATDKDANNVPGWTVKDDPRKTKFGSFIRATSLDELPQLWNVFVGDMSLVGPRPEQTFYVEKFRHEIPAYMLRHKMKAGITGWAQVNGWRGDTSLHKRIECDIYYIRNWSLWLDIKIIFLTFWKGFINKNAY